MAFDHSRSRWFGIGYLIAEPEGPSFISSTVARSRVDRLSLPRIFCGDIAAANTLVDELIALADEKDARYWKAFGMAGQGCVLTAAGKSSDAIQIMNVGIDAMRSTGATLLMAWHLSQLAKAHATIAQFDEAWHCIGEAMTAVEATKETWCEAEVYRIVGEIALIPPETDVAKAEAYFERALAIARAQQAKSWELRGAMSMARLWRDQGKPKQARELLAPVYGWFPKCGLNYQATQEHSSDQSSGSFDCKNCKTNVLKWSGVYDYSRWTPVPK